MGQYTYVERYSRMVRHEWLDLHIFETIGEGSRFPPSGFGSTTTNAPTWAMAG